MHTGTMETVFLHEKPITATWHGGSGRGRTVTARPYEHVGRLYLAGRRVNWLIDAGASLKHPDAEWLARLLDNPRSPRPTDDVTSAA